MISRAGRIQRDDCHMVQVRTAVNIYCALQHVNVDNLTPTETVTLYGRSILR